MEIFDDGGRVIYTPKIKSQVRKIPVPSDFAMDIVEYDMVPPILVLGSTKATGDTCQKRKGLSVLFIFKG